MYVNGAPMSSTGSEDWYYSDPESDRSCESDDSSLSSSGNSEESDLEGLYESFEFDEHVSLPPEPSRSLLPSGSATRDRKLYPGADLSTFQ